MSRRGSWIKLRRGIYATAETYAQAREDPRAAHALRVAAAVLAVDPGAAASHASAAVLWQLALLRQPAEVVTLTAEGGWPRAYPGLRVHAALLPPEHLGPGPLPVTSVARTVVDLARLAEFRDAVIAADSALHRGLADVPDLHTVLRFCARWPGARCAARVLEFADGRSKAPSESLARVVFAELGLPAPEPQVEIFDASGRIGIVDFLFREYDTVAEVDGRVKYEQRPDNSGPDRVLWREKRREDRLRGRRLPSSPGRLGAADVRAGRSGPPLPGGLCPRRAQADGVRQPRCIGASLAGPWPYSAPAGVKQRSDE